MEIFTEELLCAEHPARSLVDLVQLTLRDGMLPETNPQRREEIRHTINSWLLLGKIGI